MPAKTKENYSEKSSGASIRDSFQTPRYATELLFPHISHNTKTIWEPAFGEGMISNVFKNVSYNVIESEINGNGIYFDFLKNDSCEQLNIPRDTMIITNPPFSLKKQFVHRCIEYGYPFALLIPADWSQWLIDAVDNFGCQLLVPNRRIDYITPFICDLVYKKELVSHLKEKYNIKYKRFEDIPSHIVSLYRDDVPKYGSWKEIPEHLIRKHSSSDFHSLWITRGLQLDERLSFVDLTNEMKDNIF